MKLEYRLYFDSKGLPICMCSHDYPEGSYILISKEIYDRANYNCKVINGKLSFDISNQFRVQLEKSKTGMPVVNGHASLVVEDSIYDDIEYYDKRNN